MSDLDFREKVSLDSNKMIIGKFLINQREIHAIVIDSSTKISKDNDLVPNGLLNQFLKELQNDIINQIDLDLNKKAN